MGKRLSEKQPVTLSSSVRLPCAVENSLVKQMQLSYVSCPSTLKKERKKEREDEKSEKSVHVKNQKMTACLELTEFKTGLVLEDPGRVSYGVNKVNKERPA